MAQDHQDTTHQGMGAAGAGKGSSDQAALLSNQLCFSIYSAAHLFNRTYKPLLDRLGLTYPQYLVMLVLWSGDGLTVKAIGEQMDLDSGTLTPLLKRLEAAGLVRRQRDPQNERLVRVTLTEAGRALRDHLGTVQEAILCATGLNLDGLKALKAQVDKLRAGLAANLGPADQDG
ncbi:MULTISPECIES: MarR family winged helix-turn-helix transcriptional regulator [Nitrospirillum]|uniref:MarR family transcriptional regulator n=1 Tax=Nitrospirillum amazonense TaxID=28077 RepID=A0A560G3H7_9PROT|nr:MarR family transcriptional regulator [Nitrospirillum amazonense]MEC4591998.1 MarR family transcriptional regulator [Nitrospirillum amazonense]TWB28392.1 MarR family transcriptional regulator [Nitrospirillum amazonense]